MIKEPAHCRIFKATDHRIASGPWATVEIAWLTPEGNDEVVVFIRDGEAHLANRLGEKMTVSMAVARQMHHQAKHRIRYRESEAKGDGWAGRYRCYEGRLEGTHRFVLDGGDRLPEGLGGEVTRCDLEVSLPALHMTGMMRARPTR